MATFIFPDRLRPGAQALVRGLRERSIELSVVSGDASEPVRHVGEKLGIERQWLASNAGTRAGLSRLGDGLALRATGRRGHDPPPGAPAPAPR
ncbi:MAG: hypothetical protein GKR94_02220 [Gammaproteobacteria bacterium]|nr:hypothetical protein [Gammaproteobacteria bacterium]